MTWKLVYGAIICGCAAYGVTPEAAKRAAAWAAIGRRRPVRKILVLEEGDRPC